ncbi:MAG: hypothetical protein KKH66_17045, partial [Proteobacteria bacterium]|nr:hypothetical protein [Pseudomonadota bacterium]
MIITLFLRPLARIANGPFLFKREGWFLNNQRPLAVEREMKDDSRVFMVHNEWDKLKEAMVGLEDGTMAPDYMPEMSWMDPEQIDIMQQQ